MPRKTIYYTERYNCRVGGVFAFVNGLHERYQ